MWLFFQGAFYCLRIAQEHVNAIYLEQFISLWKRFVLFFRDRVLLCSPARPGTCNPPALICQRCDYSGAPAHPTWKGLILKSLFNKLLYFHWLFCFVFIQNSCRQLTYALESYGGSLYFVYFVLGVGWAVKAVCFSRKKNIIGWFIFFLLPGIFYKNIKPAFFGKT